MRNTARKVTVIPSTVNLLTHISKSSTKKRRVAGYARVSTDSEEQFTSYEAQVEYYTQYIRRNPEWQFVKMYTDEGISGCNTKNREGFKEMIDDAMAGQIDLIVTKSVSRFARNTVDSLVTIRKLKEKGVEVYFEKENIYTFDSKGELLLTIMSSLAQEESRSISENVTWGQRKRFADGKVSLPYKHFLGYQKGADDLPKIVEEEAAVVRRIYKCFMEGQSAYLIAKGLTASRIPTPAGNEKWTVGTVKSILTNEKYKGSALLQKKFTVDFLTKKMKSNEGEVPQYYIEHSHEAIISPEEFDKVQEEIRRRKNLGRRYRGNTIFSARIVCGDCGAFYGRKVWGSTGKYRRVIWQCNHKFKGEHKCQTPHLYESAIKDGFVQAMNQVLADNESVLEDCRLMQATVSNCAEIEAKMQCQQEILQDLFEQAQQCVNENAQRSQSQEEYAARYKNLVGRYEKEKACFDRLSAEKMEREAKGKAIEMFINEIQTRKALTDFDERLWLAVINKVTIHADGGMTFTFQSGIRIKI